MRHPALQGRRDKCEKPILDALYSVGATVCLIREGGGVPDAIVGYNGDDIWMEFKTKTGKVSNRQKEWHSKWKGSEVHIVRTPEDALGIIGALDLDERFRRCEGQNT